MEEIAIIAFAAALMIGLPIMVVVTYVRALGIRSLRQRLERLEQAVAEMRAAGTLPESPAGAVGTAGKAPPLPEQMSLIQPAVSEPVMAAEIVETADGARSLENLIGGQALGWLAVVVLLFATGFFLRYAFENQWIGPVGRVSLGVLAGVALTLAGRQYSRRGWRVFSQMLTAGGVVLLYLSTYAAFGFYHLISQREAGVVLALVVAESALLALRYEAPAIALMAVLGGLLTPLLMHSERDQYVSLFAYLVALDAGIVGLLWRRNWSLIGVVGLAGTQGLFWLWHAENYHPEKLPWAIGFQAVVYLLFFGQTLAGWRGGRRSGLEGLARMPLNAACFFGAAYVLLRPDYRDWLGAMAVGMAALYALAARWLLSYRRNEGSEQLTALAISMGFLALAFPLQAKAPWVALGWAAQAGGLWWFGVRVRAAPLRLMAAAMAILSIARIAAVNMPWTEHHAGWPVLNRELLPSLAAVTCLAASLAASRRRLIRLAKEELAFVLLAAIGCVLLVWLLISADIIRYFDVLADTRAGERDWQRLAQTWLSVWWALYATAILASGFFARQAWLRWTALGLYAVTIAKVFLIDMAELDELYRIAAFFVLALVLGCAAWAYHRFQPSRAADPVG